MKASADCAPSAEGIIEGFVKVKGIKEGENDYGLKTLNRLPFFDKRRHTVMGISHRLDSCFKFGT